MFVHQSNFDRIQIIYKWQAAGVNNIRACLVFVITSMIKHKFIERRKVL